MPKVTSGSSRVAGFARAKASFEEDAPQLKRVRAAGAPWHAADMSNPSVKTGGCQCGALRYVIDKPLGRPSICHCRMCQKAFGNAFAPLVTAPGLTWVRGEPRQYRSSNKVSRGFCADCGTPITYQLDGFDPEIAIATLDRPGELPPVIQVGLESKLSWFDTLAELPTRTPEDAARAAKVFSGIVSNQHADKPDE